MNCKVTKYPKPNVETLNKKEVEEEENQKEKKLKNRIEVLNSIPL